LFICEGQDCEEPIGSLPGVSRWSVDRIGAKAKEAAALGIPCIALFPNTPENLRTSQAEEALNRDNLICRAIRAIKDAAPEIGVLTDVALDPYTAHGHDGLTDELGNVINDDTVSILVEQALVQAAAGADIVAPSDMMDGRVAAIRGALEIEGHQNVAIMAYAAKYASAFYGPFREAVGSQGRLKGDKRGYQMDPANIEEALREVELDLAEGADFVMVKPGLPYLDVVARVKDAFGVPTFAYQVSGEYAMIEHAAAAGAGDRDGLILETLIAFKRAGATGVLTYHAVDAARLIRGS
jgi:porphobilinogen synthase